jgi:hypothetical protein
MAKPRAVPANAVIHLSVEERRARVPGYQPVNLPPGIAVHRPAPAMWRLAIILALLAAAIYFLFVR